MIEKILNDAVALWGQRTQSMILIEEMAELTQAIIKQQRESDVFSFTPNMLEEMVDVTIMLTQMTQTLTAKESEEFVRLFYQKIRRLNRRIEEEKAR
jgi:NTP pyrophosphatase (non-canonical NTP hydrolase)